MALSHSQSGVLRGIVIGASVTLAGVFGAMIYGPSLMPDDSVTGTRLAFALRADIFIAVWLGLSVGRLARHRFFTPEDIDGGGLSNGTGKARLLQATLQNSLEQSVLAILAHCIWMVILPARWALVVWVAVVLFIVGRLLFVRGYEKGAPARALGFALTFYPSMLMLLISLVWLF